MTVLGIVGSIQEFIVPPPIRPALLRRCLLGAIPAGLLALRSVGAEGASFPPGFQETTVFAGLVAPTAVKFAPDGRVFVAEKSGIIKVYSDVSSPTPTVFADLGPQVYDYWDRGLLGLELDPDFPARPFVYVLYTLDRNPADPTSVVPTWNDACPSPPGPNASGCPALGRLSRLDASAPWPAQATEQVLLEAFPQQFPSHSVGGLAFGPDRALYVSTGEGASFTVIDYGQLGGQDGALPGQRVPRNPLGDPPVPRGALQAPPGAEGGALRSQSLRRVPGEPAALSGALLRLDPNTGEGLPDNPLFASPDPNARRIVAYGLRNPLRFALRPGTREIFIGDVGWNKTDEIDRVDLREEAPANFGWPCYEGAARQPGYEAANLALCQNLYAEGSARAPVFAYDRGAPVVPGDGCPTGTSSVSGLAFYTAGVYPPAYRGALFFSDWARRCVWAMLADSSGAPDPSRVVPFASGLSGGAVALETGTGGDLFYADFDGGRVQRIRYDSDNRPPVAVATATPTGGDTPLEVQFDASSSYDADGGDLSYSWDFDQDGLADSMAVNPAHTFTRSGPQGVELAVEDPEGARGTTRLTIHADNTAPRAVLSAPVGASTWGVGTVIAFAGGGTDAEDGALPMSALRFTLVLNHCPAECHPHTIQQWSGLASGTFTAPDHEYPSSLELRLTVTDAGGLSDTASVVLLPRTVDIQLTSDPPGLMLSLGGETLPTPFARTVIVGSRHSVAAPSPQVVAGAPLGFHSWSDGGAASHLVVAPAVATTFHATYRSLTDLSVSVSASSAVQGGRLALRATVRNAGPASADAIRVDTTLPPGMTLVSSTPEGVCALADGRLECLLPKTTSGGESSVTATLRAGRAGPFELAVDAQGAQAEANPADNRALLSGAVRPAGDLSGDLAPDLVWQSSASGAVGVWTMDRAVATGSLALQPDRGPDPAWVLGGLADFDADGHSDLVWRHPGSGVTEIWLMDGLVRRAAVRLPDVVDPSWVPVGAGDMDGDGWPDLLWRHRTAGANYVTLMRDTQPVGGRSLPSVATAWEVVALADLNGDGSLDVWWRRSTDGLNAAWIMGGLSVASSSALPTPADPGWRAAAVADYDADGDPDLVFRHQVTGVNAVLFLDGLLPAGVTALPGVPDLSWRLVGPR